MEPKRFMDDGSTGFERDLLAAARHDEPPSGALLRGAAVLGLAASSASITATTAGSASAASAKAGSAIIGSASIAKWLGIGAAVGLVTTSGVRVATDPEILTALTHRTSQTESAPHRATPASNVPTPVAPAPAAEAPATSPKSVAVLPDVIAIAPKPRAISSIPLDPNGGSAPTAPSPPSLAKEVDALERARSALLAHRPNDVFRALDDYKAARRTSVLEAEAELLRIEALLQSGQQQAAKRLAEKALEREPNGAHAARLREIVR